MIHLYGKPEAGILTVESDTLLSGIEITDMTGGKVETPVLCEKSGDGIFTVVLDAANLTPWTPGHPVLYDLKAAGVSQRFGFCELRTFSNTDILLNGERIYLRGYIRGIEAHEHPNMTGGTAKEAAVKNIRQAKKYGL